MKKPTVTLISGLPGSGKTSLLNHLLRNRGEKNMGVIQNSLNDSDHEDSREVVEHEQIAEQPGESFVELTDGCICCSLREDLLADVWQLAQQGLHDSILIEAAGVAEPTSVAEVFLYVDENGDSLANVATLDTLVTIVNAETFLNDYNSTDELCELGIGLDEDDNRDLVRLMVDQIEFANVVVLNKSDLVSPEDKGLIMNLLRHLNPEAKVVLAIHGEVPIEEVVSTGRFPDASNGGSSDESKRELDADSSSSDISSFYYRANRPFHPQRLWDFWMDHELAPSILRSRGNLWLATRNAMSGFWSQAGQVMAAEPAGKWWAETDRSEWPQDDPDFTAELESVWHEQWGDRRQELLIISQIDPAEIEAAINECLLTDAEMQGGPEFWSSLEDPFSPWETCLHDHDHDHDCSRDHDHG